MTSEEAGWFVILGLSTGFLLGYFVAHWWMVGMFLAQKKYIGLLEERNVVSETLVRSLDDVVRTQKEVILAQEQERHALENVIRSQEELQTLQETLSKRNEQ